MAILKSEIRNKFTTIPNSIVRAKDLSDGDYRLLIYLFSLPNNWKINQSYLGQELGCNTRNIRLKIKRIKDAGYLEIIKSKNKNDINYTYILKEKDVSVKNLTLRSVKDLRSVADRSVNDLYINTDITNTDNKVINTITTKEDDLQQPIVEFNAFEFYENNFGTLSSFISEKLVAFENEYGNFKLQKALEESVLKGAKNLSYVEAILQNWKDKSWEEILQEKEKIKSSKSTNNKFTSFNDL